MRVMYWDAGNGKSWELKGENPQGASRVCDLLEHYTEQHGAGVTVAVFDPNDVMICEYKEIVEPPKVQRYEFRQPEAGETFVLNSGPGAKNIDLSRTDTMLLADRRGWAADLKRLVLVDE